jgi:hypothetical protein
MRDSLYPSSRRLKLTGISYEKLAKLMFLRLKLTGIADRQEEGTIDLVIK